MGIKSALASTRLARLKTMQESMPRGMGEADLEQAAQHLVREMFAGTTLEETADIVFESATYGGERVAEVSGTAHGGPN